MILIIVESNCPALDTVYQLDFVEDSEVLEQQEDDGDQLGHPGNVDW